MKIYEEKYQKDGYESQRRYPNTSLIATVAPLFFPLPRPERAQTKVLEIGCGSCPNLLAFCKEGFDAYGLDSAPTGIELGKQLLAESGVEATFEVGSFLDMPFKDNMFDLVYDVVSTQCINFADHKKCYVEAFRCLKPGGYFYSYHIGQNSISYRVCDNLVDHCTVDNIPTGYPIANNGTTCFLSYNEAKLLLMEAGFTDIQIETETRTYKSGTQMVEYLNILARKPE